MQLRAEADEKGSNGSKCHLRPLHMQLLAQLLHLLSGTPLNILQLLQLLLQGFYSLPLLLQGCSMLADEGLAVCLTMSQGGFCLTQFRSQPLFSFLNQAMMNCRPAVQECDSCKSVVVKPASARDQRTVQATEPAEPEAVCASADTAVPPKTPTAAWQHTEAL